MKIKYWLIISFLIVMLLPLVALYLLYLSLSQYDQQQNLNEYLEFTHLIDEIEPLLNNTSLYEPQPKENYNHIQKLTNENLKIDLFRYDGFNVYSSMKFPNIGAISLNQELVFRDLYELQKTSKTYSVKKPVFDEQELVGVYEITVGRKAWVETLEKRSTLMVGIFLIFFIALYVAVIFLLNRKLNRPLDVLQSHMVAFANGKNLQQKLPKTKDEIGELNAHFEQMKLQIEETREALAREQQEKEFMIAALSHDLKTPLTVIRTYTEALENNQLIESEREEYRKILFNKLDHMKHMIDDLSIYTALQSSQNHIQPVHVNGDEFFDILLSGYEEPCSEKQLHLVTKKAVQRMYFLDPKQMIRVVDNLMDNSIRYTPVGGYIWLGAISSRELLPEWIYSDFRDELEKWRQDGTVILIQNEGKGISPHQLDKIFQPFYQEEEARGRGATSGLGLSIAKLLMAQHQGKINIWSVKNKGTLTACWLKER